MEKVWCVEKERRQCVGLGSDGDGNDCQEGDGDEGDGGIGWERGEEDGERRGKMRRKNGQRGGRWPGKRRKKKWGATAILFRSVAGRALFLAEGDEWLLGKGKEDRAAVWRRKIQIRGRLFGSVVKQIFFWYTFPLLLRINDGKEDPESASGWGLSCGLWPSLLMAKRTTVEMEKVWCVEKERRQCVRAGSGGDGNDCQEGDGDEGDGGTGWERGEEDASGCALFLAKGDERLLGKGEEDEAATSDGATAPIGIKLDGTNYALWSQVVEMYISGRLINSMHPSLVSNFIRFPTTKLVWDAIATTYVDGSDTSQVYDLRRRVTRLKQAGDSLEKFYNKLQGLWREIDFRRPNPMECPTDIQHYNSLIQEERVYLFLDGLDDHLDHIRCDVLQIKPFPTVEQAYAHVRREALHQAVMTTCIDDLPRAGLASKSFKHSSHSLSFHGGKSASNSKSRATSDGTKCSHYGGAKHTHETYFKLHGYPDWWHELQARKRCDGNGGNIGQTAMAITAEPHLSFIPAAKIVGGTTGQAVVAAAYPHSGNALLGSNQEADCNDWILDSGATYHMTFDAGDFSQQSPPRRTSIDILTKEIIGRERKNCHILETARALLLGAHVPNHYWGDAVATTVHLINCMPSRVLEFKTPLQVLSTYVSLPTILMLPPHIFGCVAYVHLHKNQCMKLDPCAICCLFLGYATHQKGYRCYDPITRHTYVTMDVAFLESDNFYSPTASNSSLQGETQESNQELTSPEAEVTSPKAVITSPKEVIVTSPEAEVTSLEAVIVPPHSSISNDPSPENIIEVSSPILPHIPNDMDTLVGYELPFRQNRGKPPNRYSPELEDQRSSYPIANYVSTKKLSEPLKNFVNELSSYHIPTSVDEALDDSRWIQAMKEEMEAFLKNKTWTLVSLLEGQKTVGCNWVFSIKYKADGSVERYKARLVAKGYTQTYGIDYQETFSPVAKLSTVRVLLSLVANLDWPLYQFDVKNVILHGDLEEEIYMDVPLGYMANSEAKIVCKLQRTLYGLKQSPRAWFRRLNSAMRKYGFQQSNSDHTLFLKHHRGKVTALIVYVDDMIITRDDSEEIARL
ncbi:uncharacterized protein [Populus alba]|uniref:uncharacterized protein n=1 Tax=Populus alba TaxID=43335 RepID=UPI003CC75CC1